jgi:HTTM domain
MLGIDFTLDRRSLSLFRILIGVIMLGDLLNRTYRDLDTFYTDAGVLKADDLKKVFWSSCYLPSPYMNASPDRFWVISLVLAHYAILVLFTLGAFTRPMTFLVWFMTHAIQVRTPFQGHGGDAYSRVMLLWAIFVPLGDYWSIDALLRSPAAQRRLNAAGNTVRHLGAFAFVLQIGVMYIVSVLMKHGDAWRPWGEKKLMATFYAINLDAFRTEIGSMTMNMVSFEGLQLLTWAVVVYEVVGSLLLWWRPGRLLGVTGFWALHLGFATHFRLGIFGWVCIAAVTALLPPIVWDHGRAKKAKSPQKDAPADGGAQKGSGKVFEFLTDSGRFVRIETDSLLSLASSCLFLAGQALVVVLAVGMLLENAKQTTRIRKNEWALLPDPLNCIVVGARLDQSWSMFSPQPPKESAWFRFQATLQPGFDPSLVPSAEPRASVAAADAELPELVDFFRDGGMFKNFETAVAPDLSNSTAPREDLHVDFGAHRWYKYWENLGNHAQRKTIRDGLVRYACTQWNSKHFRKIVQTEIFWERQTVNLDYTRTREEAKLLERTPCPDDTLLLGPQVPAAEKNAAEETAAESPASADANAQPPQNSD